MNTLPVMQGFPPTLETLVSYENWEDDAFARWGQLNTSRIFPTARVYRGSKGVCPLEVRPKAVGSVEFHNPDGELVSVEQMLRETETDGFLVMQDGKIVYERYLNGMKPETQHISQSVSKSMIGLMIGILYERGLVELGTNIARYLPELRGCRGYEGTTVQQNLDMTTGTQFREDPADFDSEWNRLASAAGIGRKIGGVPDSIYDYILTMEQARPHGEQFEYVSSNCEVMAWLIQRVTGAYLPDLFSDWIWSRLGAEQDAYFALDRRGMPITHGLFNATLRDFARLGQMVLQDGFFNGEQIVPARWIAACRRGDREKFHRSKFEGLFQSESAYSNFWWVVDQPREVITALGFRGQFIYIDPAANLIIVKLSSLPHRELEANNWAYLYAVLGFRAIARALV
jgi:CubicO group peptidase (beta-lactamase class C family)